MSNLNLKTMIGSTYAIFCIPNTNICVYQWIPHWLISILIKPRWKPHISVAGKQTWNVKPTPKIFVRCILSQAGWERYLSDIKGIIYKVKIQFTTRERESHVKCELRAYSLLTWRLLSHCKTLDTLHWTEHICSKHIWILKTSHHLVFILNFKWYF